MSGLQQGVYRFALSFHLNTIRLQNIVWWRLSLGASWRATKLRLLTCNLFEWQALNLLTDQNFHIWVE
jgi:hypothetical protein